MVRAPGTSFGQHEAPVEAVQQAARGAACNCSRSFGPESAVFLPSGDLNEILLRPCIRVHSSRSTSFFLLSLQLRRGDEDELEPGASAGDAHVGDRSTGKHKIVSPVAASQGGLAKCAEWLLRWQTNQGPYRNGLAVSRSCRALRLASL